MSYLILPDYKKQIQSLNLSQVIGNDNSIIASWQQTAQEKVISYLTQKYDTDSEFTDTRQWDNTRTYNALDRVYLDAPAYVPATAYLTGDHVTFTINTNTFFYECISATTGAFDATNWTLVGPQYAFYYGKLPYPKFDLYGNYPTGSQVWWKNNTYTSLIVGATLAFSGGTGCNRNYFPDQLVNGQPNQQWGVGTPYSIPAATDIADVTFWTPGDNRSSQMVEACIDIVLYKVHQRISPNNIPELRHNNYMITLKWLEDCAKGTTVTAPLTRKQPNQGGRIRFGSQPKLNNSY